MIGVSEEWLPVLNWDGIYEISSFGNVRSLTRTFINRVGKECVVYGKSKVVSIDRYGYCTFKINKKGKQKMLKVHREVLKAFSYLSTYNEMQVNHINGKKADNRLSNLEWTTQKKNCNHYWNVLAPKYERSCVPDKVLLQIISHFLKGEQVCDIATRYSISIHIVKSVLANTSSRPLLKKHKLLPKIKQELRMRRKPMVKNWIYKNIDKLRGFYRSGIKVVELATVLKIPKSRISSAFTFIGSKYPQDIKIRQREIRIRRYIQRSTK